MCCSLPCSLEDQYRAPTDEPGPSQANARFEERLAALKAAATQQKQAAAADAAPRAVFDENSESLYANPPPLAQSLAQLTSRGGNDEREEGAEPWSPQKVTGWHARAARCALSHLSARRVAPLSSAPRGCNPGQLCAAWWLHRIRRWRWRTVDWPASFVFAPLRQVGQSPACLCPALPLRPLRLPTSCSCRRERWSWPACSCSPAGCWMPCRADGPRSRSSSNSSSR